MENIQYCSIRSINLNTSKILQAKFLNRTWRPKNTMLFLKDCLNIANAEKPTLFQHYLHDANGKIQLRSKWELTSRDRGSFYQELTNGLLIRKHLSNDRICDLLVHFLDYELGLSSLPLVIIKEDQYYFDIAA